MLRCACLFALVAVVGSTASSGAAEPKKALDFKVKNIKGKDVDLSNYQGKVLLIVNVGSQCGNTPQYANLENLYKQYAGKGLVILGFPANEFGQQEPGSDG